MTDTNLESDCATLYDAIPYFSMPYPKAHIERLAARALLFGISPPPIETAKVLEFGCASGGHLLPMATMFPDAEFVGVDLSNEEITAGRKRATRMGVANLDLYAMSITDVTSSFGEFDYIIAHGVYSWVPEEVRQKLLSLCKDLLTAHGVAYISYNALPGWQSRLQLREMMLFHVKDIVEPEKQVKQAWALLHMLRDGTSEESTYGREIRHVLESLTDKTQSYFLHDFLSEENTAFYLHEFVGHAEQHGMKYLCDSELANMDMSRLPEEVRAPLSDAGHDPVLYEQYLDFLRNRGFRNSLLVHDDVELRRDSNETNPIDLGSFYISPNYRVDDADSDPSETVTYVSTVGNVQLSGLAINTALLELAGKYQRLTFQELLDRTNRQLDQHETKLEATDLATQIISFAMMDLVDLGLCRWPGVAAAGDVPKAFPLARQQIVNGDPLVATLRHQPVELAGVDRMLLPLLDGKNNRSDLFSTLFSAVECGELAINREETETPPTILETKVAIHALMQNRLKALAEMGLLVE